MRNPTTTNPRLRIRREALRQLTAADLTLAAAGTWVHGPAGTI